MTFDVAVVGAPFLDLTFEGLPRIPAPGEELVARTLHVTPGGTAMQAIGAARLGLSAALVSGRGGDHPGRILRALLHAERVHWIGPEVRRSAVTAVMPDPGGAAMATALGDEDPVPDPGDAPARATILSLGRVHAMPEGSTAYATTGSLELDPAGERLLVSSYGLRAVIVNEREAAGLTGRRNPREAAVALADRAVTAVVTRGERGAIAVESAERVEVPAPDVDVADVTGAGDLFASAYVWADLAGLGLESRLAWATLYASLSVRVPTALAGALTLQELLDEGRRRGLSPPG